MEIFYKDVVMNGISDMILIHKVVNQYGFQFQF